MIKKKLLISFSFALVVLQVQAQLADSTKSQGKQMNISNQRKIHLPQLNDSLSYDQIDGRVLVRKKEKHSTIESVDEQRSSQDELKNRYRIFVDKLDILAADSVFIKLIDHGK